MRKTYSKPELIFDSFDVETNIAACASNSNHDRGTCVAYVAGMPVFTETVDACEFKAPDGSFDFCYYVPTADNTLFGS